MKNILFYGDSNTWGFDPSTGGRYPYEQRWTSICAKQLGDEYNCIPSGMNGRTTMFDDPVKACRNGLTAIDYVLQTHKPLDLSVVMLGTNDLKHTTAEGSAEGLKEVLQKVLTANERFSLSYPVFPEGAKILLISPVRVTNRDWFNGPADAVTESEQFAEKYRNAAEAAMEESHTLKSGIFFLDAAFITEPSKLDGVHLGADGHAALGFAIAEKIRDIMK